MAKKAAKKATGRRRNLKRVVVIEGEDAAPEAMRPTIALVDRLGAGIEWVPVAVPPGTPPLVCPDLVKDAIQASDATLFGSTSGPSTGAIFYLRWGRGTFANVRPTRWQPGYRSPLASPEGIDFVIVRENLEDAYVRIEGDVKDLAALGVVSPTSGASPESMAPGKYALKVISEAGSERVIRFAFELARKRKQQGYPGRLTLASKYNMLPQTDGLFKSVGDRLASDFPDVEYETFIIDNFARYAIASPKALDVVVLPNLYGDVMSDLAAALVGGLGVAASGCYGDDYAYFESAHGTAPDIAGQNIINPTATILSAAMMLDYLELPEQAAKLRHALAATYADGTVLTPDMGGRARTDEFCAAIARRF